MMMLHDLEPSGAVPAAWALPSAAGLPVAAHDIASALARSPSFTSASVQVTEVMCRVGVGDRAGAHVGVNAHEYVVTGAHHIVLPRDGALACSVQREVDARVVVDSAMALVVAPGQRVRIRNATPSDHAATVITVTPALLDLAGDEAMNTRCTPFGAIVLSPAALLDAQRVRCLANMIREVRPRHPEAAAATLASATVALLRHFVPAHDRTASTTTAAGWRSTSRSVRAADAVRAMLAAEPGAQHTLDGISARVGISPFHLARVFRARTGFSIHQYLVHIRMARALLVLGDGDTNLSRLALTLGFCSHSHFATTFRRHFGRTPRDVRAMLRAWPTEPQTMDRCACMD